MAKGDKVTIKSEIGGQLSTDVVEVKQAGGRIKVDWGERSKGIIHVNLLGRTDKIKVRNTYALIAVRAVIEEKRDDED